MFQTLQVGGVLESSGPPLDDGHRDFKHWCILGWGIHETQWANSNDAKCMFVHNTATCMDILLPAIHMLMLRLPWSRAAATEDSQAHTSSRLAPAPGWVVAMLATRAALQVSRSRSCGVMVENGWDGWERIYIVMHMWPVSATVFVLKSSNISLCWFWLRYVLDWTLSPISMLHDMMPRNHGIDTESRRLAIIGCHKRRCPK